MILTYDLSKEAGIALYDALYRFIRKDILSGKLKAGDKLPSKRALAERLQVSVVTVENAYAQLVSEGYVFSRERSGFYVEKVRRAKTPPPKEERAAAKTEDEPTFAADFTSNRMSAEDFPFSVWAKLMRETLLDEGGKLVNAEPHAGAYALRKALSDYLYRSRAIDAPPENIVIGAGTEYICSLLVQLLGRNKVFGTEDPGYSKTSAVYGANGAARAFLPLDKSGVDMKALRESGTDILHISPTHHYPTGIVTPIGRRQEILAWAEEKEGRYVIEDDYDSEFRFAGRLIPTLKSSDTGGKVIYINTFSKTLAPSIRISYMILPDPLLQAYGEKLGFYACPVPSFEQYALAKFIGRGYFERHLSRMKNVYKKRRDALKESLENLRCRDRLTLSDAESGLHFTVRADTALTDEEIVQRAKGAGVKLSCLSQYCRERQKKYEHCLLFNYSGEKSCDLSFLDEIFSEST